ncbi:MAG: (2Fe-2S)-binding protein [Dehalococcoidia bacterium]|nr:MAG: (2Fe-2S)-binding protein [Dehalococcoidia bacterium]
MSEQVKKEETHGLSRREFLKDAGLVVGGATIGSMGLLSACGKATTETLTQTKTVTQTGGVTTVTKTGGVTTVTVTAPPTGPTGTFTTMTINSKKYELVNLSAWWSLSWVLREVLGLVGTKTGCNRGECGTCTIIMNGKSVASCMVLAVEANNAQIQTIEGLSGQSGQKLNPLQQAIFNDDALQCGFCTPGFLMSAQALLNKKPKPTFDEVREALSGHICTCGNTKFYVDAVMKV